VDGIRRVQTLSVEATLSRMCGRGPG
jgi:hypothetical protein